jgi:hypothetical protein
MPPPLLHFDRHLIANGTAEAAAEGNWQGLLSSAGVAAVVAGVVLALFMICVSCAPELFYPKTFKRVIEINEAGHIESYVVKR